MVLVQERLAAVVCLHSDKDLFGKFCFSFFLVTGFIKSREEYGGKRRDRGGVLESQLEPQFNSTIFFLLLF